MVPLAKVTKALFGNRQAEKDMIEKRREAGSIESQSLFLFAENLSKQEALFNFNFKSVLPIMVPECGKMV